MMQTPEQIVKEMEDIRQKVEAGEMPYDNWFAAWVAVNTLRWVINDLDYAPAEISYQKNRKAFADWQDRRGMKGGGGSSKKQEGA